MDRRYGIITRLSRADIRVWVRGSWFAGGAGMLEAALGSSALLGEIL